MTVYRTTIVNGRRLCESPHLICNPTDRVNPSPDVLPPGPRKVWDQTHALAKSYYKNAWDIPEMTAWREVKMRYPNGAGSWHASTRNPTAPPRLATTVPDPSQMIVLGRVLEYVVQKNPKSPDAPPVIEVLRFKDDEKAPKLLWSDARKMLLVLPEAEIGPPASPNLTGLERSANLYRKWAWGQQPRGYSVQDVKDYKVKPIGMADTIVYRSGKGTKVRDDPPGVQEYIHQFGDGVVVFQGPVEKQPKAIMIRGGDLDVLEPGIVN